MIVAEASKEVSPPTRSHVRKSALRSTLLRPETTAIIGTIIVFLFFAWNAGDNGFLSPLGTRNYLEIAANIGILAVPITLLLIAGEFDLSVGVMIGAASIVVAYPIVYWGWPLGAALLVGSLFCIVVGSLNGLLVVRLGIPSFLVTLASMFIVKGAGLALTLLFVDSTQIFRVRSSLEGDWLLPLFSGTLFGMNISLAWWIVLTLVAAYVLSNTRFGNWIYASGGDREAAVKMGVPVARVKIVLYILVALASMLVGVLSMIHVDQANVVQGQGKEFEAAAAAVIGGAAITGGYGSPIGAFFGALLFGIVSQGFFYTDISDHWFYAFVGIVLLLAVAVNSAVRRRAAQSHGGR